MCGEAVVSQGELILLAAEQNTLEGEFENVNTAFGQIRVRSLPFLVKCVNIIHPHAEDEKVLLASLLGHLNVGSIHGTDG